MSLPSHYFPCVYEEQRELPPYAFSLSYVLIRGRLVCGTPQTGQLRVSSSFVDVGPSPLYESAVFEALEQWRARFFTAITAEEKEGLHAEVPD